VATGIKKLIRDCKENQFRTPIWKEKDNVITVTFKGITHNKREDTLTATILTGISPDVIVKVEGVIEEVNKGVKDKLAIVCMVLYKDAGLKTVDIEKRACE
jgi:ATP-dependent DNA helicase RecG